MPPSAPTPSAMADGLKGSFRNAETGRFERKPCPNPLCDGILRADYDRWHAPTWSCDGLVGPDSGPLFACDRSFPRTLKDQSNGPV